MWQINVDFITSLRGPLSIFQEDGSLDFADETEQLTSPQTPFENMLVLSPCLVSKKNMVDFKELPVNLKQVQQQEYEQRVAGPLELELDHHEWVTYWTCLIQYIAGLEVMLDGFALHFKNK